MFIAITGTPGTGKTSASKLLAKWLGYGLLRLNEKIKAERLYSGYDSRRKTYVADIRKVEKFVRKFRKDNPDALVEGHLSHLLPASIIDMVIVLRCRPDMLEKRLRRKGWARAKIKENMEAELIGLISWEARRRHKKVFEVDTTRTRTLGGAKRIEKVIRGKSRGDKVDWTADKRVKYLTK